MLFFVKYQGVFNSPFRVLSHWVQDTCFDVDGVMMWLEHAMQLAK